jgi:hypothetical protein
MPKRPPSPDKQVRDGGQPEGRDRGVEGRRQWRRPAPRRHADAGPSVSVRRMHSSPIGPIAAAIANPMTRPRTARARQLPNLSELARRRRSPAAGVATVPTAGMARAPIDRHRKRLEELRLDAAKSVVAVAGGTGFVGGAIARELAARGHRVVVLSHRKAGGEPIGSFEYRMADVTRPESLAAALAGVDALVISLGFRNSPDRGAAARPDLREVDAGGTEALVAAARRRASAPRLHVGRRRGAGRAAALVPGQVARRGGGPRQRHRLHDLPAELDLRPRRSLAEPVPRASRTGCPSSRRSATAGSCSRRSSCPTWARSSPTLSSRRPRRTPPSRLAAPRR